MVRADAAATVVPVRLVQDVRTRETPCPPLPLRRSAERAGKSAAMIEVVLRNGRVLRVSETIAPEASRRPVSALDG